MKERFYKQIIEQSPVGYAYHKVIYDEGGAPCDYMFLEVNASFEKITGLNREDIIGKRITQIIPGIREDKFDWIKFYGDIAQSGGNEEIEQYSAPFDKYYRVNVYSPEKSYFITQFVDITQEKAQAREHMNRNLHLEKFLETTPDGFIEADRERNILQVNDSYCRMSGYTTEELLRLKVDDIDTEGNSEGLDLLVEQIIKTGAKIFETWHRRKDGSLFNVEISTSFIDLNGGKFVSFCRDITESKQMEKQLRESEKNLIMSQRVAHLGSWYLNLETNEVTWSEELYKMYGFDPSKPPPPYPEHKKLFTPESWELLSSSLHRTGREGIPYELELETVIGRRKRGWMWVRGEAIRSSNGEIKALWGAAQDITKRKKMDRIIYNEKEQFRTTLLSVGEGVISTDNHGRVLIINGVGEKLTGWSQKEAAGRRIEEVLNITDSSHAVLVSRDGTEMPVESITTPIKDEKGKVNGVVVVFRDITEKKQRQDEIERLSYHDQLTGIYNRRFYEEELARLDIERNLPFTLVIGDVNGLKLINDTFGHITGDLLLQKVAELLSRGCRGDDIIARLGGDEFIIILPGTDGEEAQKLIRRIKDILSKETVEGIDISVSFGFGTKTSADQKTEEIFKSAEDMMYNVKLYESPSMRGRAIDTIIKTLYEKNKREEQHSRRVSKLCAQMGEILQLPEIKVSQLKTAGLLHDIGKIAIEGNILNKSGKLSSDEWDEIRRHSEIGYRILSTVSEMSEISEYVLAHHERWDGKGYPKGLRGEEIPFEARIIAIADAFDAMTTVRSYSEAISTEEAIEQLKEDSGKHYDPELLHIFIEKVADNSLINSR